MEIRRTNIDEIFYYHPNHLGSTSFVTDQNQTITQGFLYAPFGEITTEYNVNFGSSVIPKYAFNAKELDEETGMYYYEARYYKPPTFISRDPLMSEKTWLSPYHYCSNNPIGRVDPNGMMDEGYITGEAAEAATAQLNASTSLDITRDPITGKLSASGEIKTPMDQVLYDAINDPNIIVEITAIKSNTTKTPDGKKSVTFDAGAFMGNEIVTVSCLTNNKPYKQILLPTNNVIARQTVNPKKTAILDFYYGFFGQNMLHEFMESYIGAQLSLKCLISAEPAYKDVYNKIYDEAHAAAPFQPGDNISSQEDYARFKNLKKIINKEKNIGIIRF